MRLCGKGRGVGGVGCCWGCTAKCEQYLVCIVVVILLLLGGGLEYEGLVGIGG